MKKVRIKVITKALQRFVPIAISFSIVLALNVYYVNALPENIEYAIEPEFDGYVTGFKNDVALMINAGRYIVINRAGDRLIEGGEGEILRIRGNGLIEADKNGSIAYYDKSGKRLTGYVYSYPHPKYTNSFDGDGPIPVYKDGKFGYMDESGALVIAPAFDYALGFYDGRAQIGIGGEYSRFGTYISDKYGFINEEGDIVIPAKYWAVQNFVDGYANVNNAFIVDKDGNESHDFDYKSVEPIGDGFFRVLSEAGFGIVDGSGKNIVPAYYDEVFSFGEIFVGGRTDIYDKSGTLLAKMDGVLNKMHGNGKFLAYRVSTDDPNVSLTGLVDEKGQVVLKPEKYIYIFDKGEGILYATDISVKNWLLDYEFNIIAQMWLTDSTYFSEGLIAARDGDGSKYGFLINPIKKREIECQVLARDEVTNGDVTSQNEGKLPQESLYRIIQRDENGDIRQEYGVRRSR